MSARHEDSVRSRAAAGIWYVAAGGIVCTVQLLLMRSGISTIPYRDGIAISLEMIAGIAGIAGIVIFMGFLQLVIAFILKVRGRQ